jgi:muramoyltetrapeptide carboxypeptidase
MKNIQLIAPSSQLANLKKTDLKVLENLLKKLNYNLNYTNYLFEKKYFLAGEDKTRLADFENAFYDKNIHCVLALRGGEGCMRLLDKIDYQKIKENPKVLFGFSDITALQNALWKKSKLQSFTGFLGKDGLHKISPTLLKNLKSALNNQISKIPFKTIKSGNATGILLGGNMTVFTALLGTPYMPEMKNNILLLEEVNESAYRLDRMFNQLRLAGIFDKISGLILGDMTANLKPKDKKMAQAIIKDQLSQIKCPIIQIPKYSHHNGQIILPIGVKAQIDTNQGYLFLDKIKNFI